MRYSELSEEQFGLLFDVVRSIRYHGRRQTTFERLHKVTNVAAIATAGFAFLSLSSVQMPAWAIALAALSALLSCTDLVVGYARMADCHRELRRRFGGLEVQVREAVLTNAPLAALHAARLEIEKDEPPIYRALDVQCHRETAISMGCDLSAAPTVQLSRLQRLTAGIFHWNDIAAQRTDAPC